jgi:hypothetical protein
MRLPSSPLGSLDPGLPAGLASPPTRTLYARVLPSELVTRIAVGLTGIDGRYGVASEDVDEEGDRVKVIGIYATTVAAKMIES